MGNSLQEQLLKSGLVTEDDLARAELDRRAGQRDKRAGGKAGRAGAKGRRRRGTPDRGRPPPRDPPSAASSAPSAAKARDAEIRTRIRALVLGRQLNDPRGEVAHNFVRGGRIKRIWVTAEQHRELSAGRLAVTVAKGRHWVVPTEVADAVLELDPGHFVHRIDPDAAASTDAVGEYAGYEVPDDLMW